MLTSGVSICLPNYITALANHFLLRTTKMEYAFDSFTRKGGEEIERFWGYVVRLVLDFVNIFTLIFSLKYNWMDFR